MLKKFFTSVAAILIISTGFVAPSALAAKNSDGNSTAIVNIRTGEAYGNVQVLVSGSVETTKDGSDVDLIKGTMVLYREGKSIKTTTRSDSRVSSVTGFNLRQEVYYQADYHAIMSGYVDYDDGTDTESPKATTPWMSANP